MGFIGRAWRGEERLWKVFWLAGFAVPMGVAFLIVGAAYVAGLDGAAFETRMRPFLSVLNAYHVLWVVLIFKCARNVQEKSWGIAAKLWGILVLIRVILEALSYMHSAQQAG